MSTCRVITIFSNKGGVGKTFVGVNIAAALAVRGKKTLIVDLDLQAGQDMARMLNLSPTHCLVDVLATMNQDNAAETIRKHVLPHPSGLHFLPGVTNPRQIGHITPDNIKVFFKIAIASYDYIIIDAGNTFSETFIAILDSSNLIFLVGTPDILAVYQVKTSLDILQSLHYPLKMVRLILNRAESRGGVAWQEVKSALTCDIFALVPSDGKVVGMALNRGVPCVVDSPKAKVSEAFFEIVDKLTEDGLYVQSSDVVRVRATDDSSKKSNEFWEKFGIAPNSTGSSVISAYKKEEDEVVKLKKAIHHRLVERMNLGKISPEALSDPLQAANIRKAAEKIITDLLAEASGAFHRMKSVLVWCERLLMKP